MVRDAVRRKPLFPARWGLALALLAQVLLTPPARAQCPADRASLAIHLDAALHDFIQMDQDGFIADMQVIDTALSCMEEPLSPELAASLHRLEACRSYLDTDDARTVAAFRAAIAIEGNYDLPLDVAPPGHLLQQLYDRARQDLRESPVLVDLPNRCTLYVDGSPSTTKSVGRPAVLQLALPRGAICYSGYVFPEDPQPDWGSLSRRTALRRGLWWGTATGSAVSLALWGGAVAGMSSFSAAESDIAANRQPDGAQDQQAMEALASRTNRLGAGAQIASGLTLGLLTAAVWVTW